MSFFNFCWKYTAYFSVTIHVIIVSFHQPGGTQIELTASWTDNWLLEMPYPVILKQLDPIRLDEVDRVLSAVSTVTCQLDPCQS